MPRGLFRHEAPDWHETNPRCKNRVSKAPVCNNKHHQLLCYGLRRNATDLGVPRERRALLDAIQSVTRPTHAASQLILVQLVTGRARRLPRHDGHHNAAASIDGRGPVNEQAKVLRWEGYGTRRSLKKHLRPGLGPSSDCFHLVCCLLTRIAADLLTRKRPRNVLLLHKGSLTLAKTRYCRARLGFSSPYCPHFAAVFSCPRTSVPHFVRL